MFHNATICVLTVLFLNGDKNVLLGLQIIDSSDFSYYTTTSKVEGDKSIWLMLKQINVEACLQSILGAGRISSL